MSYLGVDPNTEGGGLSALLSGAVNRYQYTATGGQTAFDAVYSPGYVDVYLNGIRLDTLDFAATNGTTVVLAVAADAGDLINIVGQEAFPATDTYSQASIDVALAAKQATLVSGTNIKTINSLSLLGAGNIAISGSKAVVDGGASSGTTINATKDTLYLMYAGNSLNLPATPEIGDEVAFLKTGVIDFSVLRNGSNIMGLAENLLVDWNDLPVTLKYLNSSIGWRLM